MWMWDLQSYQSLNIAWMRDICDKQKHDDDVSTVKALGTVS